MKLYSPKTRKVIVILCLALVAAMVLGTVAAYFMF